jgi:hypothetical protein
MYSAHWNWNTQYGSVLGRKSRPSVMVTASFPFGAPTTGESFSDFEDDVFESLEVDEASDVRDKFDVGGLPSCERVRGV